LEILPPGKGWLLIEFGGNSKEESDAPAKKLMAELKAQPEPPSMKLLDDPLKEKVVWKIRDSGLGASARVPNQPDTWEGWEDSAVSPEDIGRYLRDGERYDPPQWPTYFRYPKDKGSFSYAIERCVGVGQCRRHEHGTMCPSYMATREEKHSTRGRARLLWEMLNGPVIGKNGWRDEQVKDALVLCLASKG